MIETKYQLRVRYAETDKMGVVYHANYAVYFEAARTEMFRQIGLPYATLEERGIMLPVLDLHCKYHKSAYYDDLLTVVTTVKEMPGVRIRFDYKILNEKGELLTEGDTTLVFLDTARNRPTRIPDYMAEIIKPYFE